MPSLGLGSSRDTGTVQAVGATANTYSFGFDGTNDYIQFEDIAFEGAFTISAWIKLGGERKELLLGDTTDSDWLQFTSPDVMTFKIAGNEEAVTNSGEFVKDAWFHFAAVRNDSDLITFYKNGSALSTTGDRSGTFTPERIGHKQDSEGSNVEVLDGNVDELALFNTDLSTTEIQAIYNNVSLNLNQNFEGYTSSANLQGWWRMGDGSDGEVSDRGDYQILDMSDITAGSNLAKTGDDGVGSFVAQGGNNLSVSSGVATLTYVDTGGLHVNSFRAKFNASSDSYNLFPAGTSMSYPEWYKVTISAKVNTGTVKWYFLNSNLNLDTTFGETEYTNIIAYVRRNHSDASYIAVRDMGAGQVVNINSITAVKLNGNVGVAFYTSSGDIETDVPS